MLSFLCEVIFELVIAPNSTQAFVSNCVFVKRHLPHTSVPPVFFIILLTVVTSFTSQKSVICCQSYYVVMSTDSSMKGFNYIIDQKTTKKKIWAISADYQWHGFFFAYFYDICLKSEHFLVLDSPNKRPVKFYFSFLKVQINYSVVFVIHFASLSG